MAVVLHLAVVFWLLIPFLYFFTAAANIFTIPALRNNGAVLGQISFMSGMLCVLFMGLYHGMLLLPALCGCILAVCAVALYEWSRRTVMERNFYIGLAGEVPAAVCETGPYRYTRHPFYSSYMLAFLAVAVAFPSPIVAAVCVINIGFFIYIAFDDERVLLASPLSGSYQAYRQRAGMVVPRFKRGPTNAGVPAAQKDSLRRP
jgi:protein-S-isoprenylcysteine O-methyltransferase Ste14